MATPNGGLITETNAQYYTGTQVIIAVDPSLAVGQTIFKTTFDTSLTFGSNDPTSPLTIIITLDYILALMVPLVVLLNIYKLILF